MRFQTVMSAFMRHLHNLLKRRTQSIQDAWAGGEFWQPSFGLDVVNFATADGMLSLSVRNVEMGYIILSPSIFLSRGLYEITVEIDLQKGNCGLGILDIDQEHWLESSPIARNQSVKRIVFPLLSPRKLRLILSGNNVTSGEVVAKISAAKITLLGGRAAAEVELRRREEESRIRSWRRIEQPKLLLGRLDSEVANYRQGKQNKHVAIVDAPEIGFAARSVLPLQVDDKFYVFVANAGDDSVSVLSRHDGELVHEFDLAFPANSTPISLIGVPSGSEVHLGVSFFRMVKDSQCSFGTSFGIIPIQRILKNLDDCDSKEIGEDEITLLYEREGCWGARNAIFLNGGRYGDLIAVCDRDNSQLWIFYRAAEGDNWGRQPELLDLPEGFEPVGMTGYIDGDQANVYVASRLLPELLFVVRPANGGARIESSISTGGLSRSSVTMGTFSCAGDRYVATGLWGGDPRSINEPHLGSVFMLPIGIDGAPQAENSFIVLAGTNTTDVVSVDIDDDGVDELVVLNYGTGIGIEDRTDLGGVMIFKFGMAGFEKIADVELPSPRIACISDLDGDGRLEVGIALFFERRLAVLKCQSYA